MKLSELIEGIELKNAKGHLDTEITGVTCDSRNVTQGTLFVAFKGLKTDGHLYIKDAVAKGAAAIMTMPCMGGDSDDATQMSLSIPLLIAQDSREAISKVALNYYGNPSRDIRLIGVTGTNGKTTTSYLVRSILENSGSGVGLIGTVAYSNGSNAMPAGYTTPEAMEFQGLLRDMVNKGCSFAVAEISSHALSLKRVSGTNFDTVVFTNLTQDHLDFHSDMEDYFQAKALLFSSPPAPGRAVINIDDPYGRRLPGLTSCPVYSYGVNSKADIAGKDINLTMDGVSFNAITPAGHFPIKSRLVGIYNVYNILAAIGVALSYNIPSEKILAGISSLTSVPGRFERIDSGLGFGIVVDYAHTENALRLLLEAASGFTPQRIITVFGCGGDRDRGKRPLMGKAAIELSDYVIVTSDNPRTEDPQKIIEDIESGIRDAMNSNKRKASGYKIIPDRRSAIEEAINLAEKGDLVVIAGKGHECYQITGSDKSHFDDREEAREAVRRRGQ